MLPESTYTRSATLAGRPLTGLVDPRKALALFRDGATVVFQGLHRYWPPLTRLVAELELELGHPCQANAYLTPPGSQGFAVHSDTHDVFVLQTAGSKRWEVHTPEDVQEVLLEPGLCMYLPTGTPHAARAQETVSLHVTLGINQLTWRGLVERTVRGVLEREVRRQRVRVDAVVVDPRRPDLLAEGLGVTGQLVESAQEASPSVVSVASPSVPSASPPSVPSESPPSVPSASPPPVSPPPSAGVVVMSSSSRASSLIVPPVGCGRDADRW